MDTLFFLRERCCHRSSLRNSWHYLSMMLCRKDLACVIAQFARSALDSLRQDLHAVSSNQILSLLWNRANEPGDTSHPKHFVHVARMIISAALNSQTTSSIGSEQLLPRHLSLILSVLPWHSMATEASSTRLRRLCPPSRNSHRQTDHG